MERTIEVGGLSDELVSKLDERASQIGVDRSSYVRCLIEKAVAPPGSEVLLTELLTPVHDYTDTTGMSEEEIEQFLSGQLADSRRGRRRIDQGGGPTR